MLELNWEVSDEKGAVTRSLVAGFDDSWDGCRDPGQLRGSSKCRCVGRALLRQLRSRLDGRPGTDGLESRPGLLEQCIPGRYGRRCGREGQKNAGRSLQQPVSGQVSPDRGRAG